jgi:hypothetical protein
MLFRWSELAQVKSRPVLHADQKETLNTTNSLESRKNLELTLSMLARTSEAQNFEEHIPQNIKIKKKPKHN